MKLGILGDHQRAAWNAAVNQLPHATLYHLFEWRDVITKCFPRFEPVYLYAEKDGELCGLLPLVHVRRPPFGSALISIPLGVYGGVVSEQSAVTEALTNFAIEEGSRRGVGYVECRERFHVHDGWLQNDHYATFRKALPDTPDETLTFVPRKQRAEVRKALDIDLGIEFSSRIDPFFNIYAVSMRNLGSPVFAKKYYQVLLEVFNDCADVLTISYQGEPVSSVLNLYFKDEVLPFYGGGLPAARPTNAFPFMYWALMRHAVERGYRQFDFGRSMKGTGAYSFKKNFGFTPEALHYQTCLISSKSAPDLNPDNPVFKTMIKLWQRMPVSLANRIGPLVAPLTV